MSRIVFTFLLFAASLLTTQANAQSTGVNPVSTDVYTAENPGWLTNLDEAYALSK